MNNKILKAANELINQEFMNETYLNKGALTMILINYYLKR